MKAANKIVMAIAGAILVIAALLKFHQLVTEPIMSKGFWESWAFFVIQIPLELGLGIWLMCGLFRKAAWLLGVLAFGLFIAVTLQKAITGNVSCGCFGRIIVNPWITFSAIDVPLFLLLLIFRPKGEKLLPPPWPAAEHFFGVALPTVVILATIVPITLLNKVERKTPWTSNTPKTTNQNLEDPNNKTTQIDPNEKAIDVNIITNDSNTVTIDANETIIDTNIPTTDVNELQQEWGMLQYIDIADSLKSGVVVVLLYHFDCEDCAITIPAYDKLHKEFAESGLQFAFIAIPPYGTKEENPIPEDTDCLTGKLTDSEEWFIESPLVGLIQEGSLVKIWEEGYSPTIDEFFQALAE